MPSPVTCNVQALLDSASCFACTSPGMAQILRVSIWASILSELSGESVTVNQLLDRGRCFACISPGEAQILRVQLLCEMNAALSGTPSPTPPTPPTPPVNDPVFDNLTHYWSMDEASGTRMDSKGSDDMLESGGTVDSASGKYGNAADFQPVSQAGHFLTMNGSHTTLSFISCSFWIYVRSLPAPGTVVRLISESEANGGALYCLLDPNGNITFNCTGIGNDAPDLTVALGSLNTWHLVVITFVPYDTEYLSVDGGTFVTGDASNSSSEMSILLALGPTFTTAAPLVPDGKMDEVALYSTTLTQNNVTTLWNGGIGKFYRP